MKVDDFVQEETILVLKGKYFKKHSFDEKLMPFQRFYTKLVKTLNFIKEKLNIIDKNYFL